MQKWEYQEYQKAVDKTLGDLEATISSGLCSGCGVCRNNYDYESSEDFAEAISNGTALDEGSFSWSSCEICGRPFGGDRYAVHAVNDDNEILHFDACEDCVYFLEYGRLDDMTMLEIED